MLLIAIIAAIEADAELALMPRQVTLMPRCRQLPKPPLLPAAADATCHALLLLMPLLLMPFHFRHIPLPLILFSLLIIAAGYAMPCCFSAMPYCFAAIFFSAFTAATCFHYDIARHFAADYLIIISLRC
jgi:hypothetical protein